MDHGCRLSSAVIGEASWRMLLVETRGQRRPTLDKLFMSTISARSQALCIVVRVEVRNPCLSFETRRVNTSKGEYQRGDDRLEVVGARSREETKRLNPAKKSTTFLEDNSNTLIALGQAQQLIRLVSRPDKQVKRSTDTNAQRYIDANTTNDHPSARLLSPSNDHLSVHLE